MKSEEVDPNLIPEEIFGEDPRDETPDPDWIKDQTKVKVDDYELEMFLSTDGKHTVRVKTLQPESRHEAVKKAMEMYDYILARYGTKQAQAVKEYGNGEKKADQETCKHEQYKFAQSHTEKNPGKWFKSCSVCGKFMGWQ